MSSTIGYVQEREEQERAELEKQKAELEEFEQRLRGGRRRRQRRERNVADDNSSLLRKLTLPVLMPLLVVILSVFSYWLLSTQ